MKQLSQDSMANNWRSQDLNPGRQTVLITSTDSLAEKRKLRIWVADLKFGALSPTVCESWASYFIL